MVRYFESRFLFQKSERLAVYEKSDATSADFLAMIEDVRHRVPTTHTGRLEKLLTRHFQEFDNVSMMAE